MAKSPRRDKILPPPPDGRRNSARRSATGASATDADRLAQSINGPAKSRITFRRGPAWIQAARFHQDPGVRGHASAAPPPTGNPPPACPGQPPCRARPPQAHTSTEPAAAGSSRRRAPRPPTNRPGGTAPDARSAPRANQPAARPSLHAAQAMTDARNASCRSPR